jgi:hypothetical protein
MDIVRRTDLRNSLEHELAVETQRKGLGPQDRVEWLLQMLSEYVERWIGFCQPPTVGMHALVQDSGFAMIEVGAGILSRELQRARPPGTVFAAWLGFLSCLSEMRDRADYRLISDLQDATRGLEDAISIWRTPAHTAH